MFFNVPTSIIDLSCFKRPEVIATYLLVYERAASLKTYSHHGKKISLAIDEGVCTRSYVASHLDFSESSAKSYLATLVRYGLLNKVKKPEINEDVYKVPAITSSDEDFSRIDVKGGVEKIYQEGKYLLSTLMYLAVDARQSMGAEISTTYNIICRFVGCSRDIARTTMAKLRDLRLVSYNGMRRLGLKIKALTLCSMKEMTAKASETVFNAMKTVKKTVSAVLRKNVTAEVENVNLAFSSTIRQFLEKRPIKINDSAKINDFVAELSAKLEKANFSQELVSKALEGYLEENPQAYPVASTIYNYICRTRQMEIAKEEETRRVQEENAAKKERAKVENIIFSCCEALENSFENFKKDGALPLELSNEERKKIYDYLSHPLGFAKGLFDRGSSDASSRIEKYLGQFSDQKDLRSAIRHRWPGYAGYLERRSKK